MTTLAAVIPPNNLDAERAVADQVAALRRQAAALQQRSTELGNCPAAWILATAAAALETKACLLELEPSEVDA